MKYFAQGILVTQLIVIYLKSLVRLTDRPDMTLDVYRGRKTTTQQQQFSVIGSRSGSQ